MLHLVQVLHPEQEQGWVQGLGLESGLGEAYLAVLVQVLVLVEVVLVLVEAVVVEEVVAVAEVVGLPRLELFPPQMRRVMPWSPLLVQT